MIERLEISPRTMVDAMLAHLSVNKYCVLRIFSYLCSVGVEDSVTDVCIRDGVPPGIGSLG